MSLCAAFFLASVTYAAADTESLNVEEGRKAFHESLTKMASKHHDLAAFSKNASKIDELAGEIESHVTPALENEYRKVLEQDYDKQVKKIRAQNTSESSATQTVAEAEAAAEKDLNTLRDADRKDARNLRDQFSKARRNAHSEVREMARGARSALHLMGSPSGVEERIEKTGAPANHAEDELQTEKDKYMDQFDSLHDQMDDLVEDIYGKVHERLETKLDALEQDEAARREMRRQSLREAAETLKMSGSLSRVEEKLHRLEKKLHEGQSEELAGTSKYFGTNAVCTVVIAIGLVISLIMNAMERRSGKEKYRLSMHISQPESLGPESFGYESA